MPKYEVRNIAAKLIVAEFEAADFQEALESAAEHLGASMFDMPKMLGHEGAEATIAIVEQRGRPNLRLIQGGLPPRTLFAVPATSQTKG